MLSNFCALGVAFAASLAAFAADAPSALAVFVKNDTGKPELDGKKAAFDAMLSARLAGNGFAPMSHDLLLRNLNDYLKNPNAEYRSQAESLKKAVEGKDSVDMRLFEDASGLRIAEFMGADGILSVSLTSFGREVRKFKFRDVRTTSTIINLRSSYTLYSVSGGAGVSGATVEASKTIRRSENLEILSDDIVNSLLDETAVKMAPIISGSAARAALEASPASEGEVAFDFVLESVSMPSLVRGGDGQYKIGSQAVPLGIAAVVAEIDGVAANLGAKTKLSKGIHTLKIRQRDIVPVELNINVTGRPGQSITLQLSLSDEARLRWKDDLDFVEKMKARSEISAAEAERLLGIAEMFRNSGYKIDIRADKLPDILQQNQSLMGPMTGN